MAALHLDNLLFLLFVARNKITRSNNSNARSENLSTEGCRRTCVRSSARPAFARAPSRNQDGGRSLCDRDPTDPKIRADGNRRCDAAKIDIRFAGRDYLARNFWTAAQPATA